MLARIFLCVQVAAEDSRTCTVVMEDSKMCTIVEAVGDSMTQLTTSRLVQQVVGNRRSPEMV